MEQKNYLNNFTTPKFQTLLLAIGLFFIGVIGFIRYIGLLPLDFTVLNTSIAFFSGGILVLSARRRYLCKNKKSIIKSKVVIFLLLPLLIITESFSFYVLFFVDQPFNFIILNVNKENLGIFSITTFCWIVIIFLLKHK